MEFMSKDSPHSEKDIRVFLQMIIALLMHSFA